MGGSEFLSLHIPFVHPVILRNPLESVFIDDLNHFGICFAKIDQIIPELCMRKELKKMPYKHSYGINFMDFSMAIVAPFGAIAKINFLVRI